MLNIQEIKMSDSEFSHWLQSKNWAGPNNGIIKELTGSRGISAFLDHEGNLLCKVIYDNVKSTHRIFIHAMDI